MDIPNTNSNPAPALVPVPENPKKKSPLKVLVFVLAALIVIAAAIIILSRQNKTKPNLTKTNQPAQTQTQTQTPAPAYQPPKVLSKQDAPAAQLPGNFPADLPQEPDQAVTLNFTQTYDNGNTVGVREFNTAKPEQAVFTQYKDYFTKAGWQILPINQTGAESTSVFVATLNGQEATVAINPAGSGVKGLFSVSIAILSPQKK